MLDFYVIYCRESGNDMKWLHHRMPVVLANSEDVNMWLNPNLPGNNAIEMLNHMQNENEVTLAIYDLGP